MDRLACIRLPAFSLQQLLRGHPGWAGDPVVVVDRQQAAGAILQLNQSAGQLGLKAGMRYAAALALVPGLRAGAIDPSQDTEARRELIELLQEFSPDVEPAGEPGVFWLRCAGFERLYDSPLQWSRAVQSGLDLLGYRATVVAGFSRYGTYAIAHSWSGAFAFVNVEAEQNATGRVPLSALALGKAATRILDKLGVRTVAELLAIPAGELRRRLGRDAQRWHQRLADMLYLPLQPVPLMAPTVQRCDFSPPIDNEQQILANCEEMLTSHLERCTRRSLALRRVVLHLTFEDNEEQTVTIQPAGPTVSLPQLLLLLRLRVATVSCETAITTLQLETEDVPREAEQLLLFAEHSPRDQDQAAEALAEIRAQFGEACVQHAIPQDSHQPELQVCWQEFAQLQAPKPQDGVPCLVRRVETTPQPMVQPRGRILGQWRLATAWWHEPLQRTYTYIELPNGMVHWGFSNGRLWLRHGQIA